MLLVSTSAPAVRFIATICVILGRRRTGAGALWGLIGHGGLPLPATTHDPPIPPVHPHGPLIQPRFLLLQPPQEVLREFPPLPPQTHPHLLEIDMGHYVLSHGEAIVEIYDGMPPAARDEHGLAWVLDEFDCPEEVWARSGGSGKDLGEVVDRLVALLLLHVFVALDHALRDRLFE